MTERRRSTRGKLPVKTELRNNLSERKTPTRKRRRGAVGPSDKPILHDTEGCHLSQHIMPPLEIVVNEEEKLLASPQVKKQKISNSVGLVSPFPNYTRPTPLEIKQAYQGLASLHGNPGSGGANQSKVMVLDSLIRTMLSQNTTDVLSGKAFATLKKTFPTWEEVRLASQDQLAQAIQICGLGQIRAERIKTILDSLASSEHGLSLEYLRDEDDASVKRILTSFKGVGPKTASCVLIFSLGR